MSDEHYPIEMPEIPEAPQEQRVIPVEPGDVVKVLNLPGDLADNAIWGEHEVLVMEDLRRWTQDDAFEQACEAELDEGDKFGRTWRLGYSFLMLASVAEFLNLKTVGEGIVKTVGLDSSATELLTGDEVEAFKRRMELRGLRAVLDYLNAAGLDRLAELNPEPAKKLRIGVV